MIDNVNFIPNTVTFNYSQQSSLAHNDYIEIDESITNFEQLTQQQNFTLIRNQYKQFILELSKIYYYFSGLECQDSVDYTITTIYSTEKTLHSDLFYSYKQTRKHITTIINYLDACKENMEENDHIPIICSKLEDCFGFCLSGFNSKITDISDYINIYSNIEFHSKINLKIKKLLQEAIIETLIKSSDQTKIPSSNVHYQNAFFNLVADDLKLVPTIDRDANLHNVTPEIIENTINQIKKKLPKIIICKHITDYLYDVFKNCLLSIGKEAWQNNIISDLTIEYSSYLENYFINPLNNYLCIKHEEDALKISDIFIEKKIGCYELADIKDTLHYLLAKNINNLIKLSPCINSPNNLIINIDSNTNIYSIYDCYFYVLLNEDKEVLTLKHLLKLNINSIKFDLCLSIFIHALENSNEEDIYIFFKNIWHNKKTIANKHITYIKLVINNYIYENSIKQKIVNAVTNSYIKKQNNLTLLYNLIVNNILANEIIEELLKNEIDINRLLKLFNTGNLYISMSSLNNDTILKIISNYSHINTVKKATDHIVNECVTKIKNLALLEKVDSKLIDDCFISLNNTIIKQFLENIINDNNKYRLAKCLINYFIKFDIRDNKQHSILHKIVLHNDKKTLEKIIANLDSDAMHKLQFSKNYQKNIPLTYAITINQDREDIITILLDNNKNIVSYSNMYGNIALLCSAAFNKPEYIELILKYCDIATINKKNNRGHNALMEASIRGYYKVVDVLLKNIKGNNTFLLEKDTCGNNALMLAIINKHEFCAMLHIENYNSTILNCRNKGTNNILMLAAKHNMPNIVKKILTKYSHNDIQRASENSEYNSLMLAIMRNHNQITKLFLENLSCIDLNKKNYQRQNTLNLAIEFNSDHLEQIIALSSASQVTNIFYDDGASDSLVQACYHGLEDKIITALIEKFKEKTVTIGQKTVIAFTKHQESVIALSQAFEQGHLHCIKILHEYLTEEDFINTTNREGNSCLVISIKNKYYDCVEYIMDNFTPDAIKKMLPKYYNFTSINHKMKAIIGKDYIQATDENAIFQG